MYSIYCTARNIPWKLLILKRMEIRYGKENNKEGFKF